MTCDQRYIGPNGHYIQSIHIQSKACVCRYPNITKEFQGSNTEEQWKVKKNNFMHVDL